MFKALDKVNYKELDLCKKLKKTPTKPGPQSLIYLTCLRINQSHPDLIRETVECIPQHLALTLLRIAIQYVIPQAVTTIIANWPLSVLCFTDLLLENQRDIFKEEMGLDLVIFRGIINRTKFCKMKLLDFQGLKLNETFCKLIIQMWPILSLKKSQLKPKKLAKVIAKAAGVDVSRMTEEVLPRLLQDLLCHEMVKNTHFSIFTPKGEKLLVKIDNVNFSTSNTFFMDYLICNCLRSITPVVIAVKNIHIKSELTLGDEVMDSLAPFIVLRGQDTEMLEGISLKQLEEGIFQIISTDICKFRNLRALDLQDCNIYLQEGRTRSRTLGRQQMARVLGSFQFLVRLDLSFNYLLGCLGELLDELKSPLEFLSLQGCDLNEFDLECLAKSRHAHSLKELNLSKICQFSIYDTDRISPMYLLKIISNFTNVLLLNLAQNHLPDAAITEFCNTLSWNLQNLRYLDIAGNALSEESLSDITRAVSRIKCFQWLKLTVSNNLFEEVLEPLNIVQEDIQRATHRYKDILASLGRSDIHIEAIKLSYAIFVDLLDVMG